MNLWTEEQVENLRRYQACEYVHPFTSADGGNLIPTSEGWVEVEGGRVVQDWAHGAMLDGSMLETVMSQIETRTT